MSTTAQLYEQYQKVFKRIADVRYAAAVLQWDQETYLPKKGAESRARQLATLTELAHELVTAPTVGHLLNDLAAASLPDRERRNVQLSIEDYERLKKLPADFVRSLSEAVSKSFYAWIESREKNSFKIFEPLLQPLVALKQQEADYLGYEHHPYNALMNEFEKGATVAEIDALFSNVTEPLQRLVQQVQPSSPDHSFLHNLFEKDQQWKWGLYIADQLGFDFEAGRQDISEHPFTTNFSSNDVRITTRIDEHDFKNMTWSTIHEVGHALYEQGLPASEYGLPLGEYASLGIHESQSRLWENCVGRGPAFWKYYYAKLQTFFPQQFNGITLQQFLSAINKVQPSLIRTEADELTYHFHVIIRYELEKRLIDGSLKVHDIPVYWNDMYRQLLGVEVPDDRQGCLQDVHWSHGSFGYFATYSLGSFYAAQFWQQANADITGLGHTFSTSGNTSALLNWLRNKVHAHGRYYNSNELCRQVTGKPLDSQVFVQYITDKYAAIAAL